MSEDIIRHGDMELRVMREPDGGGFTLRVLERGVLRDRVQFTPLATLLTPDAPLPDHVPLRRPVRLSVVEEVVTSFYGLPQFSLRDGARIHKISFARQVYFYLAREMTNETVTEVAAFVSKDHTTALYGHTRITVQAQGDAELKSTLDSLRKLIQRESERLDKEAARGGA